MTRTPSPRPPRRGVTMVETAIVLGLTLVCMLAIFEYGRFLMVRQLAQNAVREGARLAVTGTTTQTTANIQSTVLTYLAGQPLQNSSGQALSASDVQVYWAVNSTGAQNSSDSTWSDAPFGSAIAVKVNAYYQPIVPTFGFLPNPVPVTVSSVMLSEAN
jgi:Flp pilus assembly protein TadG